MTTSVSTRPRTLLVDSNLLLLLIVGSEDRERIGRFKRTMMYTADDFYLLVAFISGFASLVVTPNVLTEVSNLAGQLPEPVRGRVLSVVGAVTEQVSERYFESRKIVRETGFIRFGLTDVSIVLTASEDVAVLTDDLPLYLRLSSDDRYVVNFNHVRTGAVDF